MLLLDLLPDFHEDSGELVAKDLPEIITVMSIRPNEIKRMTCWVIWQKLIDYCVPRSEIDRQTTKISPLLYDRNTLV